MSAVLRILLVTHAPWLMHASLLLSQGYEVEQAYSLSEARQKFRPGAYDLVLISVNGNHREVVEFCEEAKQQDSHPRIALLSDFTAYLPEDECPDGVVRTKHDPSSFLQQVRTLMGKQAPEKN